MGGSQSSTTINQLSEQLNNIAASTVQNCEVAISQDQTVKEVNTGIWFWSTVKLTQTSEIKSECFSSVDKQNELQNNLINTISQTATTNGIALLDAFSATGSSASANLTNIIRNQVTMSNIQTSYNAIKQKQSVDFANSGLMVYRAVDLTQGSKIFAAATLNELQKAGVFNTIQTYLDQSAATTLKNPLDFLTDLVGGIASGVTSTLTTTVLMFFVIILSPFILIALISRINGSGSSDNTNDSVDNSPNYPADQPAEYIEPAADTTSTDSVPLDEVMPVMPVSPPTTTAPRPQHNNNNNTTNTINTAVETAGTAMDLFKSLSSKKQAPVQATV